MHFNFKQDKTFKFKGSFSPTSADKELESLKYYEEHQSKKDILLLDGMYSLRSNGFARNTKGSL